jgi:SAM-dependent methyltransferase
MTGALPGASMPMDSRAWRSINYRPTVQSYPPTRLVPLLEDRGPCRVLEIGCGGGEVCVRLALAGHRVFGLDINRASIRAAQHHAAAANAASRARFIIGDALQLLPFARFDVIVLVRVLTCFPAPAEWQRLLDGVRRSLAPRGIVYIHDFAFDASNDAYRQRYAEASSRGWRTGNFVVPAPDGLPLFIAHHHTPDDLSELSIPYETVLLKHHEGESMRGHVCTMFEFIGQLAAPCGDGGDQ